MGGALRYSKATFGGVKPLFAALTFWMHSFPLFVQVGIVLVAAYLLGALPFGYWLVLAKTGQDVRQHGSGGTGTTNVKRLAGNQAAFIVLALDLLKGAAAVLLAQALLPQLPWVAIGAAFLALVGHSKSIFIGFTGGKAAATGLGTMVALMPLLSAVLACVAVVVFLVSRTVSVASLTVAAITPPLLLWWHAPLPCLIYGCMAAIFVAVLHKDNIVRLLAGKENRLL